MILLYMDMLNKYVKWKLNLVIFAFKCWLREQIHYIKPIYDHLISLWIILSNSSPKSSSELSWRCKCNTKWELWECELLLKAQNHEFFFIFILLKNPFRVRDTDANHVKMLEVTLRPTITNLFWEYPSKCCIKIDYLINKTQNTIFNFTTISFMYFYNHQVNIDVLQFLLLKIY